jgi:HSP20 family molecular chaperone IbpA
MGEKDKNKGAEQEKRVRELEDKIKRLEEEKGEVPEGTAASILKGLGGIIPGFDGLLKGLEKSEAFRERLEAIDKEIEIRMRSQPLKRTEGGVPSFQSRLSRETVPKSIRPTERQAIPRVKREVLTSKEPLADVFDEETHLRVLAELPGVEEKDIKVKLNEAQLVISTDTPTHKYYKEITLPYASKGQVDRSYRNGVLELTLQKE